MSNVFALLFLIFIGLLIWGLISPKSLSKFGKKPISRRDAGIFFGLAALFFMILTGATAPASIKESNNIKEAVTVQQSNAEVKPTIEVVSETQTIPFSKEKVEDSTMAKGTSTISTIGVNGEKTITFEIEKKDDQEISRKQVKEEVTKQPVNEVTKIGTKVAKVTPPPRASSPAPAPSSNCDPNYSGGCVPIVSYDLDCPDIGFRVYVVGTDIHGFDGRDNDGVGCESY